MQLHIKAAALMAATFVGGCGFVPKNPPKPTEGQRIPINLTAPNPRPWAGPMLAQPSQPAVTPIASTPTVQTPAPSGQTVASSDTPPPTRAKGADSETQPPKTENKHEAKAAPADEPIAMWPVLLTFNPNEQLDSSVKRLPSERVSYSWPEKPVKDALPDPAPATKPSPTLPEPSQATTQPIDLTEIKVAPPSGVANAQPPNPTAADQHQNMAANTTSGTDPQGVVNSVSESATNPIAQGNQPDAQALYKTDALAELAPQTEPPSVSVPTTDPEPEPSPPLLTWSAQAGMTLSELLSTWGADQNWIVRWASEADFKIEAPFSIQAPDFLAAAAHIFKAYQNAGRTFTVRAYANQVLVVTLPTD